MKWNNSICIWGLTYLLLLARTGFGLWSGTLPVWFLLCRFSGKTWVIHTFVFNLVLIQNHIRSGGCIQSSPKFSTHLKLQSVICQRWNGEMQQRALQLTGISITPPHKFRNIFCIWVKSTRVHFGTRVQQNRIYFKCWIYKLDHS